MIDLIWFDYTLIITIKYVASSIFSIFKLVIIINSFDFSNGYKYGLYWAINKFSSTNGKFQSNNPMIPIYLLKKCFIFGWSINKIIT